MRDAPARPPASLASARRIAAPASRVPPAVGAAHPPIRARGEGGAVRWPRQAHAARPPPPQRAQRGGAQPRRNPENGAAAGGLDEAAKPCTAPRKSRQIIRSELASYSSNPILIEIVCNILLC